MSTLRGPALLGLVGLLAITPAAMAQSRPYIGFVYPAGGQQGTTFQIKLGGQYLTDVNGVLVTGSGVSAKVVEYRRKLNPQEITLLYEQLKELKRGNSAKAPTMGSEMATMMSASAMMTSGKASSRAAGAAQDEATRKLIAKIETRVSEHVLRAASESLSSLVFVEVTISAGARPGPRELRLVTPLGVSNPLVFHVGQLTEFSRKPMITSPLEVLGKEELAQRKRPDNEVEDRIPIPCTANGQVACGEVNRYRFEAHKGQHLVITVQARQLIPFIADAVPGWFQPVLAPYDAKGKEVAYDDDYRFQPDPVICYQVPQNGEYVLAIYDAIYRGREDFVYRITIGELPFITSIFPLGGRAGHPVAVKFKGWNLESATLRLPTGDAAPGIYPVTAAGAGFLSNRVPFALNTLPEDFEKEPNNDPAHAQKVKLPVIINGRINRPDDWDVFQFTGHAGDTIVAEVYARRLGSPLDSLLKLTDATGKVLALNDDHEDPEAGINTHDADSYLMVKLPANGTYYVHVGDTARSGGEDYAYRLRLSAPQPDFALRVVPSSVSIHGQSSNSVNVSVIRKEGFTGPIKLSLKNPPTGISSYPVTVWGTQTTTRLGIKSSLIETKQSLNLSIEGRAMIGGREVVHEAVPAEDRMQAFLWRHLVPAEDLKLLVVSPSYEPPYKRGRKSTSPSPVVVKTTSPTGTKAKFTQKEVAGRLKELQLLF